MNNIRILASVPVYHSVEPLPFMSFLAMSQESGKAEARGEYAIRWMVGGPKVKTSSVRNTAANLVIDKDATHLLMIDDDMVLPQDMVKKLLYRDVDIIVPLFFRSADVVDPCIFNIDELDKPVPMYDYPKDSMFECPGGAGTGVMLIKAEVLKALDPIIFKAGGNEDVDFCLRSRELGFKTWCDSSIKVSQMSFKKPIGESNYLHPKGLTVK